MSERDQAVKRGIVAVRLGYGANCSSIGSVLDTLFASAVVGGAILAAVAAALAKEAPEPKEPDPPAPDAS
jgi:hypothetical protein